MPQSIKTNHEMMSIALKSYCGKTLTTSEIKKIVLNAFPQFNKGSLLPNDHAISTHVAVPAQRAEYSTGLNGASIKFDRYRDQDSSVWVSALADVNRVPELLMVCNQN